MQRIKIKKCGLCKAQDSNGIVQNSVKRRTSTAIKLWRLSTLQGKSANVEFKNHCTCHFPFVSVGGICWWSNYRKFV